MMKQINGFYLAIIVLFTVSGCATVDIRSPELKTVGLNERRIEQAQEILDEVAMHSFVAQAKNTQQDIKVVTRDVWTTAWVRWLTPITQSDQRLSFRFGLGSDLVFMTYLDGRRQGQTIGSENGVTFLLRDQQRLRKRSQKIKLYLDPVRDYFLWPGIVQDFAVVVYEGQAEQFGRLFDKVFVTNGPFEVTGQHDQLMVWIDRETQQIRFIEFTLRALLKSYRGVVEYDDYRLINGLSFPHRIILRDAIDEQKFSHQFIVESME